MGIPSDSKNLTNLAKIMKKQKPKSKSLSRKRTLTRNHCDVKSVEQEMVSVSK